MLPAQSASIEPAEVQEDKFSGEGVLFSPLSYDAKVKSQVSSSVLVLTHVLCRCCNKWLSCSDLSNTLLHLPAVSDTMSIFVII